MKLRITGNSHVACLKHGLEAMPLYGDHDIKISGFTDGNQQRQPLHTIKGAHITLQGKRLNRFTEVTGSASLDRDAIWGVCMLPQAEYLYTQQGKPKAFKEDCKHVLNLMRDMRKSRIRVFGILTPGPLRSNPEIYDLHHAIHVDRDYREYLLNSDEEWAWIDRPPDTHDSSGCLKPEYAKNKDHANAAYGALMMQQILDHLSH